MQQSTLEILEGKTYEDYLFVLSIISIFFRPTFDEHGKLVGVSFCGYAGSADNIGFISLNDY